MKTRFDQTEQWITGYGEICNIKDMETTHLLNIIRMFQRKPTMIQSFLIKDITNNWSLNQAASLSNITSLSIEEIQEYFYKCPLFIAMKEQLEERGVNVEQMMKNYEEED